MKRSSSCCLLLRLRNTKPDGPKIMVTTSHRPHICWPHATINAPSMHRKRNPLTGPALFPKKFTWPPKMPSISLSPHVFSLKNSMKFFVKIHENCSPLPLMVDHDFRILELISRFIFNFFLDLLGSWRPLVESMRQSGPAADPIPRLVASFDYQICCPTWML